MSEVLLKLREVSKSYRKTKALNGIDCEIKTSEITGIIGPDGAGKSTLVKICAGIMPYKGSVLYRGSELRDSPEIIKPSLSFMPQGIGQNLYMELTVDENIEFFAALKGVDYEHKELQKQRLLEATGLKPFRDRLARNLSGGMKQKLGICCSLISMPELLILDEPTTGIDPLSRRQLWNILNEYLSGTENTIVYSTSYMDEAERCHSVLFLQNGEALYWGTPEKLTKKTGVLEDAFFELFARGGEAELHLSLPPDAVAFEGADGIVLEGVTKRFGDFTALDGVGLEIKRGEIFGLLGPNGAGKTTLIKCMVGLLKADEGSIRLTGLEPESPALRHRIGYMSQIFSLYGDLTVRENIELYGSIYGLREDLLKRRLQWIVEFGRLQDYIDTQVRSLPGGMKQRLSLGCATVHLPEILFLDEPTSGVDPVARALFWQFIRKLSRELGMTIVVTTHNL
ncbi:MAG: ABC transporter ATP-binding protein, partial [Nitrospirae bacterium]